jgi:hypothetical protein
MLVEQKDTLQELNMIDTLGRLNPQCFMIGTIRIKNGIG